MRTELHPDELLEDRLRTACHAVIPHLSEEWSTTTTRVAPTRTTPTRAWGVRLAALGLGAVVVAGVVVANSGGAPSDPLSPSGVPSASVLDCGPAPEYDQICVDRLAVVPGANDYFTGPASLGTPTVEQQLFDQPGLIRCIVLSADGTSCERIEGVAATPFVTYPTDVPSDSTVSVPGADGGERATEVIEVGTTYTTVSPQAYAQRWGLPGTAAQVRGHEGMRFESDRHAVLVWQEDVDLLVWVGVPLQMADQLSSIAEGVQRVSGPSTMPYVVAVTALGTPWDTNNNNGDGLVFWRQDGVLFTGPGYAGANAGPVGLPFVEVGSQPGPDQVKIGGAGPADATQVRVTIEGQAATVVDLTSLAGVDDARFFYLTMDGWDGGSVSWSWLDADGLELSSGSTDVSGDSGVSVTAASTVPMP